ncbi:hypothetical protein KVT40_002873 [Elsinoe batatas]|uniref:Uncharacterized protein n=1 Tax=Elsinoe batatas TaxID=2601811 RepID=A0A8K0PIZ7_9PEZI|nr:hypothetical protein KVT40_002873 [Elsinoe batatas]
MRYFKLTSFAFASAFAGSTVAQAYNCSSDLSAWPSDARATLTSLINKKANSSNYAAFDMDNTSYRYDLTESLLAYLSTRGILNRSNLDPSLKLVPFKDTANYTETLYSYYNRLCEIDDYVCYPWIAQSFAGFSLRELKTYVDELMALPVPINTTYLVDDVVTPISVSPPPYYEELQELYQDAARGQVENGLGATANQSWVVVKPEDIL